MSSRSSCQAGNPGQPISAVAGEEFEVTVYAVTNPAGPPGPATIDVSTSADPTPVAVNYTLTAPSAVHNLSVAASSVAPGASNVTYVATFDVSNSLTDGSSTITLDAPMGTVFPAACASYVMIDVIHNASNPCVTVVSGAGTNVIRLLASIANGEIRIVAAGVTNPNSVGTITVTTSSDPAAATAPVLLAQAPVITSANAASFTTGVAGSFMVTTTGTPTASISISSPSPYSLPFDLSDAFDGTASLDVYTSTPAGVYTFTLTANNWIGPEASQRFTLTVNSGPAPCPSPWTCADIGNPTLVGSQLFVPATNTWTINAGGSDITGAADQFHFVWQTLAGDGSVSARVASQTNSSSNAKAGVMLRASTDPGSPNYAVVLSPGAGIKVQERSVQGGATVKLANPSGTVPAYLKVTRAGNTFTAYTSADGVTWSLIAGSTATVNLGTTVLAGLAVTSHNAGALSTVTFDHVQVSGNTTSGPPSIALAPAAQSTYTAASATFTATVLDGSGNPLSGTIVTFDVVSGPNAGQTATALADIAGHATFTLTGTTAGTDVIQATFVDSTGTTRTSNQVQVTFTTPSSGGVVISNLTVNDTTRASQWSVQPSLQVGNTLYSDRTYTLTAAPSLIMGDPWIRDANGSKASTGNPLVTFTINLQATVFVGMDTRVGRPSWLDSTWTDTGSTETGTGPVTYELFQKTFAAGSVALGPIGSTADSMYTIAVG